jgi:hypothetical protein
MNFYVKSAAAMVPGASRLPWVPGRGDTLPDADLEREVEVDRDHLARYAHVCAFTLRDALPPTYPHAPSRSRPPASSTSPTGSSSTGRSRSARTCRCG